MINLQNLNTWPLIMLNLPTSFNQFLSLEECSQIYQTPLLNRKAISIQQRGLQLAIGLLQDFAALNPA
jgi:hypothetical protein